MPDFILALDQGTTSSRAILFDRSGSIHAVAQREFEQHYPQPGWVEHDPNEIWSSQSGVMSEALARGRAEASDIAAIGITNQRETVVVWDRETLEPIHNAIVWQDRRTAGTIDRLKEEGFGDEVRTRSGLVLDAYFSASKLAWILDHVEGARARAERGELAFGTIDSWLVARLTRGEVHVTDVTNACRTMLFNIHERRWDDVLLERFGIPRAMLPEVKSSSEVYGTVRESAFGAQVPIATFGQVCFDKGMGKNTYGTGCFMVLNTGHEPIASDNALLTTIGWQVGDDLTYALEGSIFIAGAVVQWLRDGLGIIRESKDVEALAREADGNDGVYLVPAFAGLGAPHWDQHARGAVLGLTRGSSAAHIARAALESIAYQSADVIGAMEADSGVALEELRVDGGASRNDLLMQFQADILDVPVVRPMVTETTALGAAYLAGLATNFWSSRDELVAQWREERRFEPSMDPSERDALLDGWHRAVERAKGWAQDA